MIENSLNLNKQRSSKNIEGDISSSLKLELDHLVDGRVEIISQLPQEINWESLRLHTEEYYNNKEEQDSRMDGPTSFERKERYQYSGSITLNPETVNLNFEEIDPIVLKITEVGKLTSELFDEAIKKSQDYYVPGYEYAKWLEDNQDKVPSSIKDGKNYYLIGSVIQQENTTDKYTVPLVCWNENGDSSSLRTGTEILMDNWHINDGGIIFLSKK